MKDSSGEGLAGWSGQACGFGHRKLATVKDSCKVTRHLAELYHMHRERRGNVVILPQESVQQSQLLRLTAWPLIKTVENEITPQIHHGRRWLSERSGAATHRMFTPGPLGLSALRLHSLSPDPPFPKRNRGTGLEMLGTFVSYCTQAMTPPCYPVRTQTLLWQSRKDSVCVILPLYLTAIYYCSVTFTSSQPCRQVSSSPLRLTVSAP
ncbi:hypothetical protein INR49_012335 [Caranx melampygus]|nr:hypothetical protein INR49_012335 [Caranx melampygus]